MGCLGIVGGWIRQVGRTDDRVSICNNEKQALVITDLSFDFAHATEHDTLPQHQVISDNASGSMHQRKVRDFSERQERK